jgi:hypothetical protein
MFFDPNFAWAQSLKQALLAMGSVRPHSPCPVYLSGNGSLFIHCAYYGEAARTSPSLRADRWGRFQALPTFPHNGINVDLCGSYNKVVRRHKSSLMESACIRTAILAQVEQCCVCIGLLESWFSPPSRPSVFWVWLWRVSPWESLRALLHGAIFVAPPPVGGPPIRSLLPCLVVAATSSSPDPPPAARTSPSLRADRWGRFQALPTFPHNGINVDLCTY